MSTNRNNATYHVRWLGVEDPEGDISFSTETSWWAVFFTRDGWVVRASDRSIVKPKYGAQRGSSGRAVMRRVAEILYRTPDTGAWDRLLAKRHMVRITRRAS